MLIIFVPARSCFLPVSPELTKSIFEDRQSNARFFQMTMFFSDPPAHEELRLAAVRTKHAIADKTPAVANIEPRKVAGRQRSHFHSEVGERLVDRENHLLRRSHRCSTLTCYWQE